MSRLTAFFLAAIGLGIASVQAQDIEVDRPAPPAAQEDDWYQTRGTAPTSRMIIQQKAQAKAYQRMARMESMKWYGMSASRPLASTTPFMGVPSPRWQMPGGRPFAWAPHRGTIVYIVR